MNTNRIYVVLARDQDTITMVVGVYRSYESALEARDQVAPPLYGTIYPEELLP